MSCHSTNMNWPNISVILIPDARFFFWLLHFYPCNPINEIMVENWLLECIADALKICLETVLDQWLYVCDFRAGIFTYICISISVDVYLTIYSQIVGRTSYGSILRFRVRLECFIGQVFIDVPLGAHVNVMGEETTLLRGNRKCHYALDLCSQRKVSC